MTDEEWTNQHPVKIKAACFTHPCISEPEPVLFHRSPLRSLGLLLALSGLFAGIGIAAAPASWRSVLPARAIQHEQFYPEEFDVAFGNGIFVGVGGTDVSTSSDGLNWSPLHPGGAYHGSIAFGNGTFVSGWGGGLSTSVDGSQWEHHPGFPDNTELIRMRHLGGLFVAIGRFHLDDERTEGVLYTSSNGVVWTRRLHLASSEQWTFLEFASVSHGNGRFVAVGTRSGLLNSGEGFTYTSVDGITWTEEPAGPSPALTHPIDIVHGDAGFVMLAADQILTSADGLTWQLRHTLPPGWRGWMAASSGKRVVCLARNLTNTIPGEQEEVVLVSEDGRSWQETPLPVDFDGKAFPRKLCSDGASFFAFNKRSAICSPDGIEWSEYFTPPSFDLGSAELSGVAYGGQGFVAVGAAGSILASREGTTWEKRSSGTERYLYDVTHADGRYVVAGEGGTLLHSTDGENWTIASLGGITLTLTNVAHGNDRFVLLAHQGNGFFWTSEDGVSWGLRFSSALGTFSSFHSLAFGNGRFIATGPDGVLVSANGINWQKAVIDAPYATAWITDLHFDGSRFLARSALGVIASPDGISWTTLSETITDSLGYGDGTFVAVRSGDRDLSGNSAGRIESSADGGHWTPSTPYFLKFRNRNLRFTYGAGRFVGVGGNHDDSARLLVSAVKPPLLALRRDGAKLMLRIDGAAGSHWTLQHSSTLTDWQTVGPVTLGTIPLDIQVIPEVETHGFWRLAEPDQ
jgi:hypothetical protein